MLLLAAPHEDENKEEKYNPPLHPSQEGNKNQIIKGFIKFPSDGGVSRSDGVGAFQFFTHHSHPHSSQFFQVS